MTTRSRIATGLLFLSALAPAGEPLTAQSEPRILQQTAGGRELHMIDVGGRLSIRQRGESLDFDLPTGTRVDVMTETSSGWLAAGRYPDSDGGDLLLLRQQGGEITLMPAPPGKVDRARGTPALMVAKGRLAGVAWLEGTRQEDLVVSASTWTDGRWGTPEIVSAGGFGAQLALRGRVLPDGSWLLVWAAVDGEDDEIMWSRRTKEGWSPPLRVHEDNQVPDITPALTAHPTGALVAWSFYDGKDYRARAARFDNGVWHPVALASGRGASDLAWVEHAAGSALLYSSVIPAAWSLVDFDAGAKIGRRAVFPSDRRDPPLLEWTDDDRPRLRWPAPAFDRPTEALEAEWEGDE